MPANYSGEVILMVLECCSVGVVGRNSILKAFPPICLLVKSLGQRHQLGMISSVRAGPASLSSLSRTRGPGHVFAD